MATLASLFVEVKDTGVESTTAALKKLSAEAKNAERSTSDLGKSSAELNKVGTAATGAGNSVKGFADQSNSALSAFTKSTASAAQGGDGIANAFSKLSFISPQLGAIGVGIQAIANTALSTFSSLTNIATSFGRATATGSALTGSNALLTASLAASTINSAGATTATTALAAAHSINAAKTLESAVATRVASAADDNALRSARALANQLGKVSGEYNALGRSAYAAARAQGLSREESTKVRNLATRGRRDSDAEEILATARAAGVAETAIAGMSGAFVGVGVGLATAIAVEGALLAIGFAAASAADKLNDLSARTNISTDRLSYLDGIAKMSGITLEDITGSADKLGTKLAKQDEETGKAVTALKELGISTKDASGETKSMIKLQEEIVMAVEKANNSADAQGAALQLLGTEYYKIRTAIKSAATEGSDLYDYMKNVGAITTTKLAKDSAGLGDKIDLLKLSFKGMANSIATAVMPVMNSIIDRISKISVGAAEIIRKYGGDYSLSEMSRDNVQEKVEAYDKAAAAYINLKTDKYLSKNEMRVAAAKRDMDKAFQEMAKAKAQFDRISGKARPEEEQQKEDVLNGSTGEGTTPSGKPTQDLAAMAAAKAELEKQKSLTEQINELLHQQSLSYLKIQEVDTDRIKVEEQATKILGQMTTLSKEDKDARLAAVMAVYDLAKAAEKERDVAKERLKIQKELSGELNKNLRTIEEISRKAQESILKEQQNFKGRFDPASQRSADAKVAGVMNPFDAQEEVINKRISALDPNAAEYESQAQNIAKELAALYQSRDAAKAAIQEVVSQTLVAEKSIDEGIMRGLTKATDEIPSLADSISGVVQSTSKNLQSGLFDLFTKGTMDVRSFFRMFMEQLLNLVIQLAIIKPLLDSLKMSAGAGGVGSFLSMIFSEKGNVFSGGSLVPFAKGGVVNSPVAFPLKGGVGIAGEAGSEAIMPLKRGPNGALGVQMFGAMAMQQAGGNNYNVTVNVTAGKDAQETGAVVSQEVLRVMKGISRQTIMEEKMPRGLLA